MTPVLDKVNQIMKEYASFQGFLHERCYCNIQGMGTNNKMDGWNGATQNNTNLQRKPAWGYIILI